MLVWMYDSICSLHVYSKYPRILFLNLFMSATQLATYAAYTIHGYTARWEKLQMTITFGAEVNLVF